MLKFEWGAHLEYLMDRFPQTKVLSNLTENHHNPYDKNRQAYLCELEIAYNIGLKMWLLMETEFCQLLEPKWLVDELTEIYQKKLKSYQNEKTVKKL